MLRRRRGAGYQPAGAAHGGVRAGGHPPQHRHPLVALVTRLVVAQAGLEAAIGLVYSRRHLPSIAITLMLVAALLHPAVERAFNGPPWRARRRGRAEAAEGAFEGSTAG